MIISNKTINECRKLLIEIFYLSEQEADCKIQKYLLKEQKASPEDSVIRHNQFEARKKLNALKRKESVGRTIQKEKQKKNQSLIKKDSIHKDAEAKQLSIKAEKISEADLPGADFLKSATDSGSFLNSLVQSKFGKQGVAILIIVLLLISGKLLSIYNSSRSIYERKLTDKLRKITGDKDIDVYIVPGIDVNAFVIQNPIGNSKKKTIYMFNELYITLKFEERVAVCLHEYGHSSEAKIAKFIKTIAGYGIISGFLSTIKDKISEEPESIKENILPGLMFLAMYLIGNRYIQMHENAADSKAVKYGYGKELISAFKKITKYDGTKISCDSEDPMYKYCKIRFKILSLIQDHPNYEDRIKEVVKQMDVKKLEEVQSKGNPTDMAKSLVKTVKS